MEYLFFWSLAGAARTKEKASKDMKKGSEIIADGEIVSGTGNGWCEHNPTDKSFHISMPGLSGLDFNDHALICAFKTRV